MHGAGIVPHYDVAKLPLVDIDKAGLRRPVHHPLQQSLAFGLPHADNFNARGAGNQRLAAVTVAPDHWVDLGFMRPECGALFIAEIGDEAKRRLDPVHHLEPVDKRLVAVGQGFVGSIGVGKVRVAAAVGQPLGVEHRQEGRHVAVGAVDVPEEVAGSVEPELRAFARVVGHLVNLTRFFVEHRPQRAGEGELLGIVHRAAAQHQHPALLDQRADFGRYRAANQRGCIGFDQSAYIGRQVVRLERHGPILNLSRVTVWRRQPLESRQIRSSPRRLPPPAGPY